MKRLLFLVSILFLLLFLSFCEGNGKNSIFSRSERRMIHIPTTGLFREENFFTVSTRDLTADGWRFPVDSGIVFTPQFPHQTVGWYIMSPRKGQPVRSVLPGVVRMVRKTELGHTIVILHPCGIESVYAHHSKAHVKVGDYVLAGQTIAFTDASNGIVYTFYTLMVNGIFLDPATFAYSSGSLKNLVVCFKLNSTGTVSASLHFPGEIAEYKPHFNWLQAPAIIDLTQPFTTQERQHVGVATPGLFRNSDSFTLNLAQVGYWCYPLPGAHVISPFGGARKNHVGTDLKTRPGDKIRAVFDGVVRFSGSYSAYGNMIVIRHSNGIETCYSHNAENLVHSGQSVRAGDVIGTVGRTGRATTEHVHFETRVNGVPFNSEYIFNHTINQLRTDLLTFTKHSNGNISVKVN